MWGKVMPDESDEILIRIQEWKFVRNFLTACQNGHFNQTCFSALSNWPRLFWRSEHPRFQGFHHKTCFLVIGKTCKNLLNPEIWHEHSSMECGPLNPTPHRDPGVCLSPRWLQTKEQLDTSCQAANYEPEEQLGDLGQIKGKRGGEGVLLDCFL